MRSDSEDPGLDYDGDERRLFAGLERELPVVSGEADRTIHMLRRDGFLRARAARWRWPLATAAAALVFVAGAVTGSVVSRRNSLEEMLARRDLAIADRVLLLQRAGSAYVQAAQSYADATANVDSSAVEVASKVLLGAAHAVARNSLDAGLSAKLATVLRPSNAPLPAAHKPVIWY